MTFAFLDVWSSGVRHADIEIEYQLTRMQLGAERLVTSSRHQIATIACGTAAPHRQTARGSRASLEPAPPLTPHQP